MHLYVPNRAATSASIPAPIPAYVYIHGETVGLVTTATTGR
ncbi:hypothetical protein BKA02_001466 [Microbacterium pseudoresistens]|uniref:Uncharacterized protein n=1 Tax=Microbacterium pseudoresistens TaxID=640634 RepID=A0A7Y9JMV0_9MICO|nr:hypothetical protein [Microbacterium pseudoresistens]